ncbi:DNL-type zinc finger protein [Euphorbia peplus]|nr:DNL-type zinc finger protein [Euphorbia peplus]
MAAGRNMFQMKRLLSVLAHHNKACSSPLNPESTQQLFPRASTIFTRSDFNRRFRTQTSVSDHPTDKSEVHETKNLKPGSDSPNNIPAQISSSGSSDVKHSATSSLKVSPRHDLAMIFTCKVCETRSVKTTCRESYEKGVVVARCDGCNNLHLMADHLGMFGKPGSVEDFLAARGEEVKKGSEETLSLRLEDLAGSNFLKQ